MKKSTTQKEEPGIEKLAQKQVEEVTTVGMDLGDRSSRYAAVNCKGELVAEGRVATRGSALDRLFSRLQAGRVVIEVGTHSPWIARALQQKGFEVIVVNPRNLRLITASTKKTDRRDARILAKMGQSSLDLLEQVEHRSEQAQQDRVMLQAREALVRARTRLVNQVRGMIKALGLRIPKCDTNAFALRASEHVPEALRPALEPLLIQIDQLSVQIRDYDRSIQSISKRYPVTQTLQAIRGVGPVTALAYVLAIDNPARFERSRMVGAYFGLVPRKRDSGESVPQLRITKAGDVMVRKLLVGAAHYILGPFGTDCDLRRFGLAIASRGASNGKKRAVVATARKLAVLMHRLWISGDPYDPNYNTTLAA